MSLDILVMTMIGGVTSLAGAVTSPAVIGFLRYGQFAAQTQLLATGIGVLLVLMILPGGLSQLVFGGRDHLLRLLAARRGIAVPTLTADRAVDGAGENIPAAVSAALDPAAGEKSPLLSLRSLEVAYSNVQVVFGVDLDVAEREVVALLGTNGAGKSTILKAIMGMAPSTGGTVHFDGLDITRMTSRDRVHAGIVCARWERAVTTSDSARRPRRRDQVGRAHS